jgi:hypothetical protein
MATYLFYKHVKSFHVTLTVIKKEHSKYFRRYTNNDQSFEEIVPHCHVISLILYILRNSRQTNLINNVETALFSLKICLIAN